MAVNAASNYPPPQYQQPPFAGGSPGVSSFQGGPSPPVPPRLIIHSAVFADKDITERMRMMVGPDQQISIQKEMTEEFGDPWPEARRKGLSVLYQYGDRPMEVCVAK